MRRCNSCNEPLDEVNGFGTCEWCHNIVCMECYVKTAQCDVCKKDPFVISPKDVLRLAKAIQHLANAIDGMSKAFPSRCVVTEGGKYIYIKAEMFHTMAARKLSHLCPFTTDVESVGQTESHPSECGDDYEAT